MPGHISRPAVRLILFSISQPRNRWRVSASAIQKPPTA